MDSICPYLPSTICVKYPAFIYLHVLVRSWYGTFDWISI